MARKSKQIRDKKPKQATEPRSPGQPSSEVSYYPGVSPPIWVDRMELATRGDFPVATLRFLAATSSNVYLECARLQTNFAHLQRIVDVLSKALNYYPTKPGPTT